MTALTDWMVRAAKLDVQLRSGSDALPVMGLALRISPRLSCSTTRVVRSRFSKLGIA